MPEKHPLCELENVSIRAICNYPFILLEKDEHADVSMIFEKNSLKPNIRFTTTDDYATMSLVEKGLGISIMPELILQKTPYKIVKKELDTPVFRELGFAIKDKKTASLAAKNLWSI